MSPNPQKVRERVEFIMNGYTRGASTWILNREESSHFQCYSIPATKKKDKKKSKKKADVDSDNDSDIDPLKRNVKNNVNDDNESEDEMIVAMKSKPKRDKKKKPGFSALAVEDSDDGALVIIVLRLRVVEYVQQMDHANAIVRAHFRLSLTWSCAQTFLPFQKFRSRNRRAPFRLSWMMGTRATPMALDPNRNQKFCPCPSRNRKQVSQRWPTAMMTPTSSNLRTIPIPRMTR